MSTVTFPTPTMRKTEKTHQNHSSHREQNHQKYINHDNYRNIDEIKNESQRNTVINQIYEVSYRVSYHQ